MKEDKSEAGDSELSALVRSGRPKAELPPGFHAAVWRRIEKGERRSPGFIERLAGCFLTPRLATAGLVAIVLVGGGIGTMRGVKTGEREARDRYVASVDPDYVQR